MSLNGEHGSTLRALFIVTTIMQKAFNKYYSNMTKELARELY